MSFKREGDDYGSLNILKKRRVAELLVEAIPEDEAFLMKNGRFACMVCPYRPVFDTVNMLAVHRKGKKHLSNAEHEQMKKHELDVLWQKRQHEQYMKHGRVTHGRHELQKSFHRDPQHSLLSAVPYDRRTKAKHKPHERRPRLDLAETPVSSTENRQSLAPKTTTSGSLPGQRDGDRTYPSYSCDDGSIYSKNAPQTISEYQKLCRSQSAPQKPLRPYLRNRETSSAAGSSWPGQCPASGRGVVSQSRVTTVTPSTSPSVRGVCSLTGSKPCDVTQRHKKVDKHRPVYGPIINEERQKRAESYLHQRCGGWKKDIDGKWVKDEEAEFDSDEEPPDLP